jgi:hypothetical protein
VPLLTNSQDLWSNGFSPATRSACDASGFARTEEGDCSKKAKKKERGYKFGEKDSLTKPHNIFLDQNTNIVKIADFMIPDVQSFLKEEKPASETLPRCQA